jgi:hypothetical protein
MEKNSIFQTYLSEESGIFFLSKCNSFSVKAERFWFYAFGTEKERRDIRIKCIGEHDIKSLRSSSVEEHIVDETDFIFWRHRKMNEFDYCI